MFRPIALFSCALAMTTAVAGADTITFKNGDKLTGKIVNLDGGKLKVASDSAGEVTVDLNNVATFTTDNPIDVRTSDGQKISTKAGAGDPGQIKTDDGKAIAFTSLTKINPPPEKWTGSIVADASMVRGNSFSDTFGLDATAQLRRTEQINDRFTLDGEYHLGRSKNPATGVKSTDTDNWMGQEKYDYFFKSNPKLYAFEVFKVEHDRIAALNYRLAPGVGIGYQWVERPDFNFNTEAGVSYIYEDYTVGGTDEHVALRLAYHVDKKLTERLSVFHNLEWLPAFDDPGDYNLTTDAGVRADITQTFFTELKAEWKRDSTPAAGSLKNDMRYVIGIGFKF